MPKIYLPLLLILSSFSALAQTSTITGRIVDTSTRKGLPYATVSLVTARDSTLITFAVADSAGIFRLNKVPHGAYLLSASYAGYIPSWRPLPQLLPSTANPAAPPPTNSPNLIPIGDLPLSPTRLQDVSVIARRPPVEINNDTIEFNTENFKTQPNAVVEEMLRKMPGVTIESDGTVKVNGQTVKRVLVNGKEFFTGDPKMATKNLNADAVDKVQVFDRRSDQATFTGVDDGNSEKTINLKLKKDRNNALFGKVTAGAGNDGRYDAQANINKFKGEEQLSLLAMANSTNRQGFSLMDVMNFTGALSQGMRNGGGAIRVETGGPNNNGLPITGLGQNQQGVATTAAGGLNYNNSWNKGHTNLNSSYSMNHVRLLTDKESVVQNLLPGNTYTTLDSTHTVQDLTQEKWGFALDQQLDSNLSFKLTPSFAWLHSAKNMLDNYISNTPDGNLLNEGYSNTNTGPGAFNFTTDALIRRRLPKKGRTLSTDFNMTYNHSTLGGNQLSDNTFYTNGSPVDSAINQHYTRDATTRSVGGNITYTEPLGRLSLLALSAFTNINTGNSNKTAFDYNPTTGKHDRFDSLLSNDFSSDYRYSGGGLSFRSNQRKINFTVGANLQNATLTATNNSASPAPNSANPPPNNSGGAAIHQSFTDILPNASFQVKFTQLKNLRFDYSTYTTQPSVNQLQPVPDLSDPLNIRTGNPGLKRTYTHNLSLTFFAANPGRRTNLLFALSYSDAANSIVDRDSITPYGTRIITPVNTGGVHNFFGDLNYGFPIRALNSRLEIGSSIIYGKNVSFINGEGNNISSVTITPNFSYNYSKDEKIDLEFVASLSINTGRYSLQPDLNTNYMRQRYGVSMTNYFPWGFYLHNEFNYTLNTGRASGYNTDIPLWNSSLAKTVLKNDRGEIKFGVQDLLNRNTGITRSIGQGNILDEKYNVLRRYFLLSFTYSLNKSGLKTKGGPNIRIRSIER